MEIQTATVREIEIKVWKASKIGLQNGRKREKKRDSSVED